jgi:hypothetical protein
LRLTKNRLPLLRKRGSELRPLRALRVSRTLWRFPAAFRLPWDRSLDRQLDVLGQHTDANAREVSRPMLAYPRRRIPTPPKHPLRRCVREGVAARLLVSFAQLCPLGKPAVGFGNGMHDTSRLQVGHAGGDSESLGFQSTPAVCIAGSVIQSLLHQLKSLPSTRKRAWTNWVPALRGQRRGERATSAPQARSDRWAPFEGMRRLSPGNHSVPEAALTIHVLNWAD